MPTKKTAKKSNKRDETAKLRRRIRDLEAKIIAMGAEATSEKHAVEAMERRAVTERASNRELISKIEKEAQGEVAKYRRDCVDRQLEVAEVRRELNQSRDETIATKMSLDSLQRLHDNVVGQHEYLKMVHDGLVNEQKGRSSILPDILQLADVGVRISKDYPAAKALTAIFTAISAFSEQSLLYVGRELPNSDPKSWRWQTLIMARAIKISESWQKTHQDNEDLLKKVMSSSEKVADASKPKDSNLDDFTKKHVEPLKAVDLDDSRVCVGNEGIY